MKVVAMSFALSALTVSTALPAGESISAGAEVWPPPPMKNLSVDYVERLPRALSLTADRIAGPEAKDKPVLWVPSGIAGFSLGQDVEELN